MVVIVALARGLSMSLNAPGTTWALEQEISDQSSGFTALRAGDWFGHSVSLGGDRLAVGAPYDDGHSGTSTGAVYVFKRTGTTWALEQEISDQSSGFTALRAGDWFGHSVSLGGDRLAVGAPYDDGHSGSSTGAVYVFKRTGTTWALEQEISDQSSGFTALKVSDEFGVSVSLDGDRLAAGLTGMMVKVALIRERSMSLSELVRLGL